MQFNQDIDVFYTYLQSQETARQFLLQCYRELPDVDAETKSYENCNAFTHYLDHGRHFFSTGKNSPIFMQPILLFYGATHLLKACLLTKRPNYPESTSILAHGVSTRKRKKKQYTFMLDEVKIQHNGLFSYAAKYLYSLDNLPFEKIKMAKLLALIPEINDLFSYHNETRLLPVGVIGSTKLRFPKELLDGHHLAEKAFIKRITTQLPTIKNLHTESDVIQVELVNPLSKSIGPFLFHHGKGEIYYPVNREHLLAIPEILFHYLLLYNLSMISRYETEWWGELITTKTEIDYSFIQHFINITANKLPVLLGNELLDAYNRNK